MARGAGWLRAAHRRLGPRRAGLAAGGAGGRGAAPGLGAAVLLERPVRADLQQVVPRLETAQGTDLPGPVLTGTSTPRAAREFPRSTRRGVAAPPLACWNVGTSPGGADGAVRPQ